MGNIGEAFSFSYDLPNDTAYAETCASIGLIFFARRMLQMKIHRKYADVMERAFYNGVLSGLALDGKSFFYVNPLEVLPEACYKDERKQHVKPSRQKWYSCACCPPNISRLLSSVAAYAYTENDDTFFVHMYMGGEINKTVGENQIQFHITSWFPWSGEVRIKTTAKQPTVCTLACRIPGWCHSYTIDNNTGVMEGSADYKNDHMEVKDGYLYLTKEWSGEEEIALDFDMQVQLIQPHTNVRENEGKLAVMRGPLVYCMEEADNGKSLHNLYLDPTSSSEVEMTDELGMPMRFITMKGRRYCESSATGDLYTQYHPSDYTEVDLRYVPYYVWNNRGEGEMQVWTKYIH